MRPVAIVLMTATLLAVSLTVPSPPAAAEVSNFSEWARDHGLMPAPGAETLTGFGSLRKDWPAATTLPIGIAYDPFEDGIWIANESESGLLYLQSVHPPYGLIRTIDIVSFGVTNDGNSDGVALLGNNTLLVTDFQGDGVSSDDVIYGINRNSGTLDEVWHVDGPLNPNPSFSIDAILGISVDAFGNIWISDNLAQLWQVELLPGGTWNVITVIPVPGGGSWAGIDFDRCRREFFVANFGTDLHQHHPVITNPPAASFPHPVADATGITSNQAGLLYTCGFGEAVIYEFEGLECGVGAIYDIDFGTPPHTVGLPPATGAGPVPRNTVSVVVFGDPRVVAASGPLPYQALEFDGFTNSSDQIRLVLNDVPPSCFYSLECDMWVSSSSSSNFVVFLDTPIIRRIDFTPTGSVIIFDGSGSQTVGSYPVDEAFRFRTEADLRTDAWSLFVNGAPIHVGTFNGATQVTAMRFTTVTNATNILAGIDNVVVRALPDIEVASFSAPPTVGRGVGIGDLIELFVRNPGPVNILQGISVGFYISPDPQITTSDQLLLGGRESIPELLSDQTVPVPLFSGARIPESWPLGPAFLGCIVDEFDDVAECTEENNTASVPVEVVESTAVEAAAPAAPALALRAPAPNPLVAATRLDYELPQAGRVELVVFDVQGRRVTTLVDAVQPAGTYTVSWDGRARGAPVGAGTYFAQLTFDGKVRTQKLIIAD